MTLLRQEWKMNLKMLLIWAFCVGISCCGCIMLFQGVADSMGEMAESFAEMGSFSAALGMDKISIGTIEGYYATEISIIFSLGGAMFAAMTGAVLLSKEEEGHTAEFLHTLPLGRSYIVTWKYITMLVLILVFHVICMGFDIIGFLGIGADISKQEYFWYHVTVLLLQIEIGSICFLISAVSRRKQIGLALGVAVFLYLMDIMCRIVPNIDFLKYITPYYYANGAELFSTGTVEGGLLGIGIAVSVLTAAAAGVIYTRRDLAA